MPKLLHSAPLKQSKECPVLRINILTPVVEPFHVKTPSGSRALPSRMRLPNNVRVVVSITVCATEAVLREDSVVKIVIRKYNLNRVERGPRSSRKVLRSSRSLLVVRVLMHMCVRQVVLVREILRWVLLMRWVDHRLNARHALLLRWVLEAIRVSFGHAWKHIRRTRLFLEVRNAYATVFFVVGTIVLLLLRGPSGLCHVLDPLLHALRWVSMLFADGKKLSHLPFAPQAATSHLRVRREYSTSPGVPPCMLAQGRLASRRRPIARHSGAPSIAHVSCGRHLPFLWESASVRFGSS